MTPEELVEWLKRQPKTGLAVEALDDAQLCAVSGHLGQDYDENGITGELLGWCLWESAARFARVIAERKPGPEFQNPNRDSQES